MVLNNTKAGGARPRAFYGSSPCFPARMNLVQQPRPPVPSVRLGSRLPLQMRTLGLRMVESMAHVTQAARVWARHPGVCGFWGIPSGSRGVLCSRSGFLASWLLDLGMEVFPQTAENYDSFSNLPWIKGVGVPRGLPTPKPPSTLGVLG